MAILLIAIPLYSYAKKIDRGTMDNPMIVKVVPDEKTESFSRVDTIIIVLAGSTLAVTAVGVIIALLAFWGYKDIKRSSIKAAEREANRVGKEAIKTAEKEANKIAREVATAVTTAQSVETTPEDAKEIIENLDDDYPYE